MTDDENWWQEVGSGQEACVLKGNLKEIDGIIKSEKLISVAKRVNWNKLIHDYEGHDLFCKHLTLSLIDKLFLIEGKYCHSHIPAPVGSFSGGYYYKFVEGTHYCPLEIINED